MRRSADGGATWRDDGFVARGAGPYRLEPRGAAVVRKHGDAYLLMGALAAPT